MSAAEEQKGSEQTKAISFRDDSLDRFARLGMWLAAAESSQTGPNQMGAAAAYRLVLAQELGLPLRAASELSIIRGRLVVSVQLMRGLARMAGYDIVRVEETDDSCTAAVVDRTTGEEIGRSKFTLADAQRAGLIKEKGAWETYPQRMLWARAAGWAMRDAIPEVALGLVTVEEVAEIDGRVLAEEEITQIEAGPGSGKIEQVADPLPAAEEPDLTPEEMGALMEEETEPPESEHPPVECRTCGATEPDKCSYPGVADDPELRAEGCIA